VLLVESKHADYAHIKNLLAPINGATFDLQWVHDFDEAARAMASSDYDVCLLDNCMGDEDGLDLIRQTLLVRNDAPLIILSAQSDFQLDVNSMHAGAADFLVKSRLTAEGIERAIRYAIERKRVETELRRRNAAERTSLEVAVENLNVSVLITDPSQPDNPLVFANQTFTATTGYTLEEVLGRNLRFLTHPDSDPDVILAIHEAVRDRRPFKGVMLNRRKDGSLYQNSLTICPVFNLRNELTNFIGLSEDVTAQHEAQEALRLSERRYAGMVANVPGMIYRALRAVDGSVSFEYVSDGCQDLFGISPEQFYEDALRLRNLVHYEDRQSYEAAVPAGGEKAWRWQGRFVLPSGVEKVVLCMGHPDRQENGDIIWDGLIMDVTDRVRAEQKAAQLAAIVESSCDAIKAKTLDGIVTSWNAAAEKMYGYTAEEMIGHPISCLLPPDRPYEIENLLKRISVGEQIQSYETIRRAKDGTLLDIALTMSPVRDSAGNVVGAATIAHDIRRRREADAQIQRQMMRIQALRNIDMAITSSLDLRVTLNVLLDQVTTHLNVDSAAVLLLNPHTHRLEYTAGRGFRSNAVQRTSLRLGEGYAGRAALERRILSVSDLTRNPEEFVRSKMIAEEGFVSYWAVPLVTKGRVEGVLEIFHRASLPEDGEWFSFLEALAGQAAIAIENAALFNDLQRSNVDLQIAYDSTLEGWSKALDLRDRETEGHSFRVTEATMTLARLMNIPNDQIIHMRRGALLHDIGKMGIPDAILLKPGGLNDEEWIIMKMHPVYAYELLSPIQFLRPAIDIPYCHHEKWDGSGYPRGLKGEQIPLSARIFAVVDVWDALRSDRPYRAAWDDAKVRGHIAQGSGSHFDPAIVKTFLESEL